MSNLIQIQSELPIFTQLDLDTFEQDLETQITKIRGFLNEVSETEAKWDSLIQPLLDALVELHNLYTPLSHLSGVKNTETIRSINDDCDLKLNAFYTELYQDEKLYNQIKRLRESTEYNELSQGKKTTIDYRLRDFVLSGIALSKDKKNRYFEISQLLTDLSNKFSNHILDSSDQWFFDTDNVNDLSGLGDVVIASASEEANKSGIVGYRLKLDFPTYQSVIQNADNRDLRESITRAWMTRSSDMGNAKPNYDNTIIINKILSLRHELSQLVGFNNYAEYSLATKMADTSSQVIDFLNKLVEHCQQKAAVELQSLQDFSNENGFEGKLESWDIPYYAEKYKKTLFSFKNEETRPFFPIDKVLVGFFQLMEKLFSIDFKLEEKFDSYHEDVQLLSLSRSGKEIAFCYLDLYAREKKRSGAWMDVARSRVRFSDGRLQLPVAYLVCNFPKPTQTQPSLLTHNDVTTLFHEFGHALHHMLTEQECLDVTGINGVSWDAVELPSQMLENWCWNKEVLSNLSGHYKTGEPLPDSLLDRMIEAKHFNTALAYLRQLVFSLFDFKLHAQYDPEQPNDVITFYNQIASEVDVRENPSFNRMPHSFSHIFSGGYAAGYYSYLWAEVLSSDAFSLFEEKGLFDQSTGQALIREILAKGGSEPASHLFKAFRGREPSIDALLRHAGIERSTL